MGVRRCYRRSPERHLVQCGRGDGNAGRAFDSERGTACDARISRHRTTIFFIVVLAAWDQSCTSLPHLVFITDWREERTRSARFIPA